MALFATGCLPIVSPPGRLSARLGYAGGHVPYHADDGTPIREKGGSAFELRGSINPLTLSRDLRGRPFDFGVGYFVEYSLDDPAFSHGGPYVEATIFPWTQAVDDSHDMKLGVTLAAERVASGLPKGGAEPPAGTDHGLGLTLSTDFRVVSPAAPVTVADNHFFAGYGETSYGGSLGLSYRNVDNVTYVMLSFAVEVGIPAGIGVITW
jgi:hypothetical protein